jgi:hypothetical protein
VFVNDPIFRGRVVFVSLDVQVNRASYKLGHWRTCPLGFCEQFGSAVFVDADACADHEKFKLDK